MLSSLDLSVLRKSTFLRNIFLLASGTAVAQAIPILVSPVLTRLYTPAEFGLMAVFTAVISSITPCLCGKYEVAQVLPKKQQQGLLLLAVALRFCAVVSLCVLLFCVLFYDSVLDLLNAHAIGSLIFLLPLALLLNGIMISLNYFANRDSGFKVIASGKLLLAISLTVVQVVMGYMGFGLFGLVTGVLCGYVFATFYLVSKYRHELGTSLFNWGPANYALMKKYREYPLYNASAGLLDGVTLAMPVFFISYHYPDAVVGLYALVIRIANAPLALISSSISQVNLKKVIDLVNHKQNVVPYILKVTAALLAIVIAPSAIVMFWGAELFAFVFGEDWREAGSYAEILMSALAVKFIASTLSSTFGATMNNKLAAFWKVSAFVVSITVFYFFPYENSHPGELLQTIVIMDCFLYFFYYLLIIKAAKKPRNFIR